MGPKDFDLGRDDELTADMLVASIQLSRSRLGVTFLVIAHSDPADAEIVVRELRRRAEAMAAIEGAAERVADDWRRQDGKEPEHIAAWVTEVAARLAAKGKTAPVAWLDLRGTETTKRREILVALNIRRDFLSERGGVSLVILLSDKDDLHVCPDLSSVATVTGLLRTKPQPRSTAATGPVGFVHLSDLHIRGASKWDQDVVRRNFLRDLPGLLEHSGVIPHLVFATGDFTERGDVDGFHRAHEFLLEVMDMCARHVPEADRLGPAGTIGTDMREWFAPRLFLTPGNHDVRRASITRTHRHAQAALLSMRDDPNAFRNELGGWWDDGTFVELGEARLRDYYAFTAMVLGDARQTPIDRGYRVDTVMLRGMRIGVLSLNSAWMCSELDDTHRAVPVGEQQVRAALDDLKALDPQFSFVLIHHPPDWWVPAERETIDALLRESCDVVLHGHVHSDTWEQSRRPGGELVTLTAGALYAGQDLRHAFQLGTLDPAASVLRVHAMTYTARGAGRWHADASVGDNNTSGTFEYRVTLPALSAAKTTAPAALLDRLARIAEQVHGTVDFVGLPSAAGRPPTAKLDTLYVPQRFVRAGHSELAFETLAKTIVSRDGAADLESRSLVLSVLRQDAAHARTSASDVTNVTPMELRVRHAPAYVVLGEPGAGKTLLLRALAWQMARAAKPLLPVVIPLREWIAEGGRKGLLSFAAADLSMRLSETVSEDVLKDLAKRGDVCLLVDGLDEVVAPEQRTFVRDAIVALASQYEWMPMVCTSRVTGYRDAPLPDTFAELTIEPLSDEELDDFARRWFANQFPGDPREREIKRSLFVAALHAEPRAKELARNPLLATLIAMVHVGEGVLPAERARLYELLVHLLVETWPQTSKRVFRDDARLPVDQQRRVLERLAFEMQIGRGADSATPRAPGDDESARDVLIERHALEAIAKREIADLVQVDDPTAEGIARRWINFVAGGLGVLVERSAGLFGFVHLSLLEYMAGNEARRRWSKSGEPELAHAMVDAAGHAHHVEMVLLMLGDRNTPRTLADAVVSGVTDAEFGLRALREDVDLSHGVVERVLDRAVERVLQRLRGSVDLDQADRLGAWVEEANRFSRRHRDVIRRHMELRLTSSESINFLAAFRVAGPTLQKLAERRPDWRSSPSKSGMDVHAVYASLDRQDAQPVNALSSSWALARHRLGPILACRFGSAAPVLAVCAWLSEHDEQDSRFDAMDALPRSTAPLAAVLACRPVAHLYEDELHSVVSFAVGRTATTGQGATHTPEIARYTAAQVVRNVASAIMSEFQRSIARSERASKSAVTGFGASPIVQKLVVGVTEKKDASSDLVTSAQAVSGVVQTASGELRRRLDAMPATVDGAHREFLLRDLIAPSLPPILQAVHTQCVLSTIATVHRGHIDSNRFDRELTWRLSALWACWSHEGIAKYVLGLEGNVPAARAKIAAYAVLSRSVLGEWPISAWLDTWRAAGEPKSWDERYVWWLCEAFDDPEDGTRIARARAVLAEAVAKEPDVNTREVAEWLQNIDLHPMTRAEAEEAQREGARRWAEEVAQYGDAGWGWLLGDGAKPAT